MTDQYAEIRAALDAAEYLGGNCFVTINSAHGCALLAERDALREALRCIAQTRTKPGDDKAALLLASVINLAFAALAQGERHETV